MFSRLNRLIAFTFAFNALAGAQQVAQTYSYKVNTLPSFTEGYRRHLEWHREHHDTLVWYAWTVSAGARKGQFIDGTFGASFAALDKRPDIPGDARDFEQNASPYVTSIAIETWTLWPGPSTETPLESHHPTSVMDVFLVDVPPAHLYAFEEQLQRAHPKKSSQAVTWYKASRGTDASRFMVILHRTGWSDVQGTESFADLISNLYGTLDAAKILSHVASIQSEVWNYEPRLSLIPGDALAH